MSFTKDSASKQAVRDLSNRLGITENEVSVASVSERDFPDMALGANVSGEMAAQMISSGWKIDLQANGKRYEYRADKYQLRLVGFKGSNHVVKS
ncbi:MAG: hypothetical protein DWQ47_09765 [Acidobacteria bacterium]|nr:MAG: hypothetical protein DWQ32_12180 [Acidobacteriota bacterium]REJ98724.1 MAG: hypothetical protein DWQ38_15300 [Acidobacteriota bacterium]REK16621.1 MAG: hypothetical protein DWQ43_00025 [Acidobacteriota bacterium]REK42532.1 MAG: hypothetical protein DWQ47_09765 [Acidobacteriota bacterium]